MARPRKILEETMEQPTPVAEVVKPVAKKQHFITFHGEGGDVEIGHNYKLNLYKRNVRVPIDEKFLKVVKDAVVTTIVQDEAGNKREVTIPMYQYSVEVE